MEKSTGSGISEWLSTAFKNPLSPLCFIVGCLLILMGISAGIQVPVLQQLSATPDNRSVSLILGIVFVAASIVLYYTPLRSATGASKASIPEEFSFDLAQRLALLSVTQTDLLGFIERTANQEWTTQDSIQTKFPNYSKNELHYRLEHLRLLGFIERQKIGKDDEGYTIFSYRLAKHYQQFTTSMPESARANSPGFLDDDT